MSSLGPVGNGSTLRYLQLITYGTYAELKAESQRTYVGFLWWIIDPLLETLVFYVVVALFLGLRSPDFAWFLLVGLTPWKWLAVSVRRGGASIPQNSSLMRQVYLPKIVFPTIAVLSNTFKFAVAFSLLVVSLWVFGFGLSPTYVALPFVLLVELLLILAVAYLVGAFLPFLPDLAVLLDSGLRLLFFVSGIFFSGESLSARHQAFFYLNPLAHLIESYRKVLLQGEWPNWGALSATGVTALVGMALGAAFLQRFDRLYPRVVNR